MFKKYYASILFLLFFSNTVFCGGFLKTSGKDMINSNGEKILLRGINLGNWLVQEGYMMQTSGFANAETELRNKIQSLIGQTNTDLFYKEWNQKYITKKDIDQVASWGFNSIRLPMHYAKLTPKDQPGVYLEEGFATIDSALNWCAKNHIYLILDLHAAPGSQNGANISDCTDGVARLWTDVTNQDRTVELWKRLAERYSDKEWIGGYDLINETVYSFPDNNKTLWDFMARITAAIREVDKNHTVFIEGNWWATDFGGMPDNLWDNNLAFSFHKYWNQTDQGTINYLITLRNKYNVPLWLGETGENSNGWFTECIELMQNNNIGYCFWPYKKIASTSGLVTIPVPADYQTLLNYWSKGGSKPSVDYAKTALMNLIEQLTFDNCRINRDVIDAMFRQPGNTETVPFAENKVPGMIYAVDYDMGKQGQAYNDKIYKNTNNSDAYNNGWSYRNDGVDIEECSSLFSNGYNVGWIELGEWLNYTINVEKESDYDISFEISGGSPGGIFIVRIDNTITGNPVYVPTTGGWQSWDNLSGPRGVHISAGTHKLQLQFLAPGFNLSAIEFTSVPTDIEDTELPGEFRLEQNYPNPFNPETTIKFSIPDVSALHNVRTPYMASLRQISLKVYDILGREVATLVNGIKSPGNYEVKFDGSNLPSGIYFCKMESGNFTAVNKLMLLK